MSHSITNRGDGVELAQKANIHAEEERVRGAYSRRDLIPPDRYARTEPFNLYSSHEREQVMARLLRRHHLSSLAGMKILDVGCGRGDMLRVFLEYSAEPELMEGIDLLPDRIEKARRLLPACRLVCGSAAQLPYCDRSFDLVVQFTLFTS